MQTKFVAKRHIVTYLSTHFDSWYEYAINVPGLEIKPEELRFVSGTVKTTKWACSAWSGSYKNKQGSVKVDVPNMASLNITVQIEDNQLPSRFWNAGPIVDPLQSTAAAQITGGQEEHTATTPPSADRNQCIFINYFTAKKRLFFKSYIEAAAGPHQLPPGGPDPEGGEVLAGDAGSGDEEDIVEGPLAPPVSGRTSLFLTLPELSRWHFSSYTHRTTQSHSCSTTFLGYVACGHVMARY